MAEIENMATTRAHRRSVVYDAALPVITVITVVYNAAAALRRTAQSVAASTYRNIEYIVVDGGSKDDTVDVIHEFADTINCWISEPDKGIYDAMNKGISLAQGKWLLFLNAGDTFVNNAVLAEVSKFCVVPENQNADLLFGDVLMVHNNGREETRNLQNTVSFLLRNMICHQCIFYNREVFKRIGLFDTQYRYIADFDHLVRARWGGLTIRKIDLLIARYTLDGLSAQKENIKKIWHERMRIFAHARQVPLLTRILLWGYAKAAYEYRRIF
jgi:glycosyltransferase involved in cell wall biosynthesis